jgi:hypothetical protein
MRARRTRWEIETPSRIFGGDGRQWWIGAYCLDLAWPWWAPWTPEAIWPDGNRPLWRPDTHPQPERAPRLPWL